MSTIHHKNTYVRIIIVIILLFVVISISINLKNLLMLLNTNWVIAGDVILIANGVDQFPCNQCGKVYRHKSSLTKHLKYECGKEAQFLCQLCPYRAKQRPNLTSHILLRHSAHLEIPQWLWCWLPTQVAANEAPQ